MKRLFGVWSVLLVCCSAMAMNLHQEKNDSAVVAWYEDAQTLEADFAASLVDAQQIDESEVSHTLMPVSEEDSTQEWTTVGTTRMVLVCAFMNHNSLKFWAEADTFRLSKETGVWVTLPSNWTRRSSEFADLDSVAARYRMVQMLGLPPFSDYDTVVEFYIDPHGLFRPAFDPSINTTTVAPDFPAWADEEYVVGETNFREWFAYNRSMAYVGNYACPWTQLGYTYDWHHGAPREGLSEYIGSFNTLARVKTRQSAWDFIQQRTR